MRSYLSLVAVRLWVLVLVSLLLLHIAAVGFLFAADHNHDADSTDEAGHHHGHSHKTTSAEKAQLRTGEIVFTVIFCLCAGSIIYLVVRKRWM